MEIDIESSVKKLRTKTDLLRLINRIKAIKFVDIGIQKKYRPISMKELDYYSNPNNVYRRYRKFSIPKKSGELREINAPRNANYKAILRALNEILNSVYTPSEYTMGFVRGKSVVTNALSHVGKNYVYNIDLKDFFPSIEYLRIAKRLQLYPFYFPRQIAIIIAGLASIRTDEGGAVLPQGSPLSPILTNIICDKLDRKLSRLAEKFGLSYSRYADDITFSSYHNVYQQDGEFCKKLKSIIEKQGFKINENKTRLQKRGQRQLVTGIKVNTETNVDRSYINQIRNLLYIWKRYGYSVAEQRYYEWRLKNKPLSYKRTSLASYLNGKIQYLKTVKASGHIRIYFHFLFQYEYLYKETFKKKKRYGINYIETTPLEQFEKKLGVQIDITQKVDVDGQSHRFSVFEYKFIPTFISVSKDITPEDETNKSKLFISRCIDQRKKEFWLIHY